MISPSALSFYGISESVGEVDAGNREEGGRGEAVGEGMVVLRNTAGMDRNRDDKIWTRMCNCGLDTGRHAGKEYFAISERSSRRTHSERVFKTRECRYTHSRIY